MNVEIWDQAERQADMVCWFTDKVEKSTGGIARFITMHEFRPFFHMDGREGSQA